MDYEKEINLMEEMDQRTQDSIYCALLHMKSLYEQCVKNEMANFAEPCTKCKLAITCNCDWIGKIDQIMPEVIEIKLSHGRLDEV